MSSTAITLELPRNLVFTRDAKPVLLPIVPSRLDRIVERNRDHALTAALFAIGTTAFALLAAFGIAGY